MVKKYRKKPVVIEAVQWFRPSDHLLVGVVPTAVVAMAKEKSIRTDCKQCRKPMADHGYIDTLEGGHVVCPGDWIIRGVKGEHYPCKPDIFKSTYEPE